MLNKVIGAGASNTLMSAYSVSLSEAVLRQRTRSAEQQANIESQLANKVKSEFISNMSHELRTPLNSVIGFAKLLSEHDRRKLKDQDIVEYARLIQDAAAHLLTVINDILDISKLQSGSLMLNPLEIDVDEALDQCVQAFAQPARDAGVRLACEIVTDLPVVLGDGPKLRQVFSNILSNAVKFTPADGKVTVRAGVSESGNVKITFQDTGVGMSEDEIRVALAPFGQVDGSRTRWREGTGLGLPIARSLVELHGGTLQIDSVKGSGTLVTITIPTAEQTELEGRARSGFPQLAM